MSALEKPEKFTFEDSEEAAPAAIFLNQDLEFVETRPILPVDYQTAVGTLALLNQLSLNYPEREIVQSVNRKERTVTIYLR